MSRGNWGTVLPSQVSEWMNFDSESKDWVYVENRNSIADKQAEGVAGLWNKLAIHDLALLADEVGMGKTFQAIGVMSLLWKMKPDARVLVMAPNRDICKHWVREYRTFLREHYREEDHLVRNGIDGGPVHEPELRWRLVDLVSAAKTGTSHFYITTIHSLSGLLSDKDREKGNKAATAKKIADGIHHELKKALGGDGFDLIIIDEAHYFRNKGGDSQRAAAAGGLFGDENSRLGRKALLLTATPSHSAQSNVRNIISYFASLVGEEDNDVEYLLKKYTIRRLRHMLGKEKSHNKYNYRHEKAIPSDFEDSLDAELFFALYQKKLVEESGAKGGERRFMYGYLEGFESVGNCLEDSGGKKDSLDEEKSANAFNSAPDSALLSQLSTGFKNAYDRFPDHPKYGALVKECVPDDLFSTVGELHDDKHLVFVRRIPSVREITQRVNAEYDELLARRMVDAWGVSDPDRVLNEWRSKGWAREYFVDFVNRNSGAVSDEDVDELISDIKEDTPDADAEEKLSSRISDLFVVKKQGERRTDCTNVSLRFRRPESLFSLFLEPPSDYERSGYLHYNRKRIGDRDRDSYGDAALEHRLMLHDEFTKLSETDLEATGTREEYDQEMMTAWCEMYELLPEASRHQLDLWRKRNPAILENLANYLKSGYLFASPVMVELYCWYTEFSWSNNSQGVQNRYLDFVDWVRPKLTASLMLSYFIAAIDSFEAMCEKITDHRISDWHKPWRALTSLQNPAWYASGDTGNRQRLILGFNSPFYPNVLTATSVFQEGVNLHLQCHKVHHYGIAWTPGDNEQRVGRVDRLFGKVNKLLKRYDKAELNIHYPYLEKSFDQEQLASFVRLKYGVEVKLDSCSHQHFDSEIDVSASYDDWQEFLRRPDASMSSADPFPALFDGADSASETGYRPYCEQNALAVYDLIAARLNNLSIGDDVVLHSLSHNEYHENALFLIEPKIHVRGDKRNQPIVVECHYSSHFSAMISGTVYYVSLRSPLASKMSLESFGVSDIDAMIGKCHDVLDDYPMVRLALDVDRSNSHFYLYARIDLPLFVLGGESEMLSDDEIGMACRQLMNATDHLEYVLFDGSQDLDVRDLKIGRYTIPFAKSEVSNINGSEHELGERWAVTHTQGEKVASLSAPLDEDLLLAMCEAHDISVKVPSSMISLELNHVMPMIGVYRSNGCATLAMRYPAVDFQVREQHVLERWFDYVKDYNLNK